VLASNSILHVRHSNFTENFSLNRGSILLSDYQQAQAFFDFCLISHNYAYQGGVFYI